MRSKQVIVELVSSRVDVVLHAGGRRRQAIRVPVDLPADPSAWKESLGHAAEGVRAAVEKLGVTGAKAVVLYQSPTQAVDFSSFPVRGSEALQAAELECLDALPYSSERTLMQCVPLGRDRGGELKQSHVLATAEREDVSGAIVDFVEAAGLSFMHAVPLNAVTLVRLVKRMLGSSGGVRGHLHIGEQVSCFLVADGGTLLFARQIRIGLESIVTSMTRPIHRGSGEQLTQLDTATARRILYEHGRPDRDTVVDETTGLKGHELGPLVQPVLQRLVIELRQSLRFGMAAETRETLDITLGGPGAAVPGFPALLSAELGVTVEPAPGAGAYAWNEPAGAGGEFVDAMRQRPLHKRLNLQPRTLTIRRNTDRLRRWLWTGGAAAIVVIGIDAARMKLRADDLRKQVDAQALHAAGQDSLELTNSRLLGVVGSLNRLEGRINEEIPGRSNFGVVIREIASRTPETIDLMSFGLVRTGEGTTGRLSGFAVGREGHTDLEQYIVTLAECPLLTDILLGDVQIGHVDGASGERFSANLSLVLTPPVNTGAALAAVEESAP